MNNLKKHTLFILTIGVLNTVILFYVKYSFNNLSIYAFEFNKIGNLISLLLIGLLIINGLLLLRKNDQAIVPHLKLISTLATICTFPLVIIVIFNIVDLEFAKDYLFGYPLKKILPVMFFLINQIAFVFILFVLWFLRTGNNLFAYVYSTFSVVIAICVLVITSFFCTFFVNEYDISAEPPVFDYGIILGAAVWSGNHPSPIFLGRIDKGGNLYQSKVITKIQLTGGNAPGELSEAQVAFSYLKDNYKISASDIFIEELTSTTNEQIRFIKNTLARKDKKDRFLFISDEFHLKRISEMADFYDLNACVISSDYKLNIQKSFYYRFRDSIGLILFWFFAI